jgi:beta-glucuronidase
MESGKNLLIATLLFFFYFTATILPVNSALAQTAMTNIFGRKTTSLNGEWEAIIDLGGTGDWRQVWTEKQPQSKTEFIEYSFEGGPVLHVPGDFNTQLQELTNAEGTVWYKKTFNYKKQQNKRLFLHFGAVNYLATVYLNGKETGKHEGGFTPFQFELTKDVKEGENTIVVRVNNQRQKDGLPGPGYDWFNYGGITREVNLVETGETYIEDYSIQLKRQSFNEVLGWVKLNGSQGRQNVRILIPELKIDYLARANGDGLAPVKFSSKFRLWTPKDPKLYTVFIQSASDTVTDEIGFRTIEASGKNILLNGKPIFLKGVNIHEETLNKPSRAWSENDAMIMLNLAKETGCNMVRLAHYPHNEHMVKLAEKMGIMVWNEIPAYQHIEFASPTMPGKLEIMMKEMIQRDRNRCGVIIWSLSNETYASTPNRNQALKELAAKCHSEDSTRLVASVINNQGYEHNTVNVWDSLYQYYDVIAVNEYLGWYVPWQGNPADTKWKIIYNKPVIISEFGGEAKYGSNFGPKDEANSWSEEYQEQIYKDQVTMFAHIPNLAGVCPWILFDYRSSGRMHPQKQNGYNRKGLMSEYGEKKKAWYVLKSYYESRE